MNIPKERQDSEPKDEVYGSVYFISHGPSGPVKVGFTADCDPAIRIRQLQIGSPEPLTLVGAVHAYASVERAIHVFLAPHLVRGEWFEREPALLLLYRFQESSTKRPRELAKKLQFLQVQQTHKEPNSEEGTEELIVRVATDLIWDWADQLSEVNTEMALPFRAWLLAQKGRKDPIGDLACDVSKDPLFPPTGSLHTYLKYITDKTVNAGVTRSLLDAWIECDIAVESLTIREQDVQNWE